jgi:hypothetical protein
MAELNRKAVQSARGSDERRLDHFKNERSGVTARGAGVID